MPEPRDPLLKVFKICALHTQTSKDHAEFYVAFDRHKPEDEITLRQPNSRPAKATGKDKQGWPGVKSNPFWGLTLHGLLMILPQVHLRKPCYDFYFL